MLVNRLHQEARNHVFNGQPKAALKSIEAALKLEPDNADLVSEKGVIFFHLKDLIESIKWMNKAVEIDPDNPYRYSSRAYIKDAMGDTHSAIQDYEKCVALDPEDAVAYNNLGMLEEKLGRKERALERFKRADELTRILSERGISIESELPDDLKPRHIQNEIKEERKELKQKGIFGIIGDVFRDKSTRKEFFQFVRNGFKGKQE